MLKSISKALNATTRLIVGNTNPAITARTHALDEVMANRALIKKAGKMTEAEDGILVAHIDTIMGRTGKDSTPLTVTQVMAVAEEADVEETAAVDTEALDTDVADALILFAKKMDSYTAVKKGRNKNKQKVLDTMAKDLETLACNVLAKMTYASQYEYANTESIKAALAAAEGKNAIAAVQAMLPTI